MARIIALATNCGLTLPLARNFAPSMRSMARLARSPAWASPVFEASRIRSCSTTVSASSSSEKPPRAPADESAKAARMRSARDPVGGLHHRLRNLHCLAARGDAEQGAWRAGGELRCARSPRLGKLELVERLGDVRIVEEIARSRCSAAARRARDDARADRRQQRAGLARREDDRRVGRAAPRAA